MYAFASALVAKPQAVSRLPQQFIGLTMAAVLVLVGCDQPSAPATPAPKTSTETPEAKLDRVIERLELGLANAQAVAGSGVVSERRCTHELIRPEGPEGPYAAEITIQTIRALAAPKPGKATADVTVAPIGDESGEVDPKAPQVVKETEKVEEKVYSLAYERDRWKLKDELEAGSIEQICFDYALK